MHLLQGCKAGCAPAHVWSRMAEVRFWQACMASSVRRRINLPAADRFPFPHAVRVGCGCVVHAAGSSKVSFFAAAAAAAAATYAKCLIEVKDTKSRTVEDFFEQAGWPIR
eukprot:1160936-Pelagomonas_calceolata.AAC.21